MYKKRKCIRLLYYYFFYSKSLRIMKITALFCFSVLISAFAATSDVEAQISLNLKNEKVSNALDAIKRQTSYSMWYNVDEVDRGHPVTINMQNVSLSEILDKVLEGQNLDYRIEGKHIVVVPKGSLKSPPGMESKQQTRPIRGAVVDKSGDPLVGVSIVLSNHPEIATVTGPDGSFSMDVPEGERLAITYVGYKPQIIDIGSKQEFSITLYEDTQMLGEVVVIGYGTQKKVNLTGSVATVNSEDIADIPVANLSNALSGRVSGMLVTSSLGKPGGNSTTQIRSAGTWNDSSPLYVIDGIVRDQFAFDGLDANEVESISVLKDGASAAIYGARAANGVILVTTKKGKIGKPTVSYTGTMGWSDATKIPDMMDGYNQALLINDALSIVGFDSSSNNWFTNDELDYFKNFNYDWVNEAWKQPIVTKHSLNVTGGTDLVRYFVGGNYLYETGSFDNLSFEKYNFRGNIEANITKNLIVGLNLATDVRNDDKPFWRWDNDVDEMHNLYRGLLFRSQMVPAYIDGKTLRDVGGTTFVEWSPMEVINGSTGFNKRKYITSEITAHVQYDAPFLKGLNFRFLYNTMNKNTHKKQFNFPYIMYNFKGAGTHGHIPTNEVVGTQIRDDGNYLHEEQIYDNSYQLNAQVNYSNTFGKHDLGALFVYEQSEISNNMFYARGYDFPSMDIVHLDAAGKKTLRVSGNGVSTARMSYIGRLNYGYDQKYLVEASFRYDGSANFAPGKRWGFFPSVSAGWRISEESFFKNNVSFINYLKFRGSVGLLGNDAIAAWQWYQKYKMPDTYETGAVFGETTTTGGLIPDVLPNPDITWEKTRTTNIGFDSKFLSDRLSLNFDYFFKHSYDILGDRLQSLPTTFGPEMPEENYAVIDGHGYEVELEWNQQVNKDFMYYVRGNLGFAINEVKVYDEAENIRPYQSLIGYNYDRKDGLAYVATDIIRTQAELDALPEGYTIFGKKPALGMLNYKDIRGANSDNPDGVIDEHDKDWVMKNRIPPYNFGLALGAKWKGWSLDAFFQGVAGTDVMIALRAPQTRAAETTFDFWRDRWTPDNVDAKFPRIAENQAGDASTFWRRDGSFVRLKNLSLGYNLPKHITSALRINDLRVFFTGSNLFLLYDKVKYFDPELGDRDNNIVNYPLMKSYSFGVNLSF